MRVDGNEVRITGKNILAIGCIDNILKINSFNVLLRFIAIFANILQIKLLNKHSLSAETESHNRY